jgi:hypothetical protein
MPNIPPQDRRCRKAPYRRRARHVVRKRPARRLGAWDRLEDRTLLSPFYELRAQAYTDPTTFTDLGDLVAINDKGQLGYVGTTSKGSGLWLYTQATTNPTIVNVNPGFSDSTGEATRDFGRGPSLNNEGIMAARDRVAASPPLSYLRTWSPTTPDANTIVASANSPLQPDYGEFSALQTFTDINDAGDVAFVALSPDASHYLIQEEPHGSAGTSITLATLTVPTTVPRVQLTADGRVLYAERNTLRLATSPKEKPAVVSSADGFTAIGAAPGISPDGRLIVFLGDRGHGPGIFLSYQASPHREIVRVAGEGKDGFTFPDLNAAVRVTGQMPQTREVTIAFQATHAAIGAGIYASRVAFVPDGPDDFDPDDPPPSASARPCRSRSRGTWWKPTH